MEGGPLDGLGDGIGASPDWVGGDFGPIEGTDWEPGVAEFAVLMIIVYVLWWADTGIL